MGKKQQRKRFAREERDARRSSKGAGRVPIRKSVLIALALILLVGLGLRLAYLAELRGTPDFAVPLVDAYYHDYWARAMTAESWFPPEHEPDPLIDTTPYFRPPGYPLFLGAVYAVVGPGHVVPRILQMLLGLASVALIFFLGRRIFDDVTGLVAAGLMATYWVFIYYEGEFLEPVLSVLLAIAQVLVLLRWRDRPAIWSGLLAGLLLGLLALVRPNALLVAPFVAWWLWWIRRDRVDRPQHLRSVAIYALGVILAIIPVTIRNATVGGEVVLISSNAGINLLIGNSERADGEVRGTMPGIGSLDTSFDWPLIVRRVEQITGRRMSHAEVSDFLAQRALENMREDPGRTLRTMLRKTALFWGPEEVADNKVVALDQAHSRVLRWVPLTFATLLAFGILGFVLALRDARVSGAGGGELATVPAGRANSGDGSLRRDATVLVLGFVVIWFASHLPFAVTSRYRVPVIPFLILYGAFLLRWLVAIGQAGRRRTAAVWVVVLILLVVVTSIDLAGYEASAARWHYQRGIAFQRGGDLESAVVEYREAVRENPNYGAVYNDLGAALATRGRVDESLPYFRKALELKPQDPAAHRNLAMALELLGERNESHRHYAEALRLRPEDADARAGFERTRSSADR